MTREEAIKIMSQMIKDEEGFLSDNTVEAHKMAIKALEREECGDCISRKEVIDTIYCECSCENLDIDFAKVLLLQRAIKALPSVTPMPKWIPVSERLPEQDRKDEAGNDIAFLVQTEWGVFFTATYDGNWCHVDSSILVESDVIAWMPLPKPYKQEVEE